MLKYANIIIEISALSLDKPFSYQIPEELFDKIEIGSLVTVPFGKGNIIRQGYVVDIIDTISFDNNKIKTILDVCNEINMEVHLIKLAYWMRNRYICTMQNALNTMVPKKSNKTYESIIKKVVTNDIIDSEIKSIDGVERYNSRKNALEYLIKIEEMELNRFIKKSKSSKSVIKTLEKKNIIVIYENETYRTPYNLNNINQTKNLIPNIEQEKAINEIIYDIDNSNNSVCLLHGVTGSGKTEVYLQVIERVIHNKKEAIVLIPEISLTPQAINRFVGRFGSLVGVMHSNLSDGERYDQWRKAKEGKISIIIGARSAIFAPFNNLGVIIIDEEHESTYKSDMPPKYNAREIAIKRGSMSNCPVVLGSATPLVESYYKAKTGKYKLLELNNKAASNNRIKIDVVDMRIELANGNNTIFSNELRARIKEALSKKEQIILFINRRGHSSFVSCRKCGHVMKCKSCDIPYTYHSQDKLLLCHYCGSGTNMVLNCPSCGSKYIKEFGVGTQKVEMLAKKEFQDAKILRMDYDTTTRKHSYEEILTAFDKKEADILIGTQMIAKGHDYENVTVVGIIAADLSLYRSDFRACEKTFQLCTQVIGRAGRGEKKGKAIIQTYSPEHYSITCSKDQNYKDFYDNEIKFRKIMGYPPFSNIAILIITGKSEKELINKSFDIKNILEKIIDNSFIEVLGPSPANVSKANNYYRRMIILKSDSYKNLTNTIKEFYSIIKENNDFTNISIKFDINPMTS